MIYKYDVIDAINNNTMYWDSDYTEGGYDKVIYSDELKEEIDQIEVL